MSLGNLTELRKPRMKIVLALGTVLTVANCYWVVLAEARWRTMHLSVQSIAWFPLFIAWVVKSLIMRFGGLKVHRQVLPFFLGLMLGDFVIGSSLSVIGTVLGKTYYSFWVY